MRANEFIIEDINKVVHSIGKHHEMDEGFVNFLVDMHQNCSEYINEVGVNVASTALYRGLNEHHKPFVIKQTRLTGRNPIGMAPVLKDEINEYFIEQFGEPFRDSALCTGSPMFAQAFGDVYAVFPVDGYKILWSPGIDDLNHAIRRLHFHSHKGNDPQVFPDLIPNKFQYRLGNITEAIKSENEVMLRCDYYYAISQRTALEFDNGIKEIIGVLNAK